MTQEFRGLRVSELRVNLYRDDRRLKAFVSFLLNEAIVIHDARIIESKGSLILCMPSRDRNTHCGVCLKTVAVSDKFCKHCGTARECSVACECGTRCDAHLRYCPSCRVMLPDRFLDIAHPVDAEARKFLEELAIAAYLRELAKEAA